MSDLREAAEMALELLDKSWGAGDKITANEWHKTQNALRQALAQPEQEPVAWQDPQYKTLIEPHKAHSDWIPLYAAPPKREWVGLTDAEVEAWRGNYDFFDSALVKEVEAKLKEKNV